MRQTTFAKAGTVTPDWFIIDATDKVLGRLATRVATILMGKHKPEYTPFVDTGDCVVITNAARIKVTGKKLDQKYTLSYSGYPGGQKATSHRDLLEHHPDRLVTDAVRRMLPKNALGRKMLKKLKVYRGGEHPHSAQQPKALEL